jgi:formylglycine-generating enzyme required for sulfatase activity
MNINEEKYRDKYLELREMMKFSIYSQEEIIQKLRNIQTFAKFHQLEVDDFNEEFILNIAQELQPFYDGLWEAKLVKDWKGKYNQLSLQIKEIYDESEVEVDWERRQYSKGKYDEMMAYLDKGGYWLDELEVRFKKYHKEQICYADRTEYLLNWDEIVAKYQDRILKREMHQVGEVLFHMICCPAGDFWMGSKAEDSKDDAEKPRHKVRMSKRFWMGETQVTQELWQKVMGWTPCFSSSKLPVECVSWYDCLVFCNKLSELKKFKPCFTLSNIEKNGDHIKKANVEWNRNANGYRLPTEAEWEYSAKAGTELIYSGSNSVDEVACYRHNSDYEIYEVKSKRSNAWGLYDMSGNVCEWCMDKWDKNAYRDRNNGIETPILWDNLPCAHVLRGGSSSDLSDGCRVACRDWIDADYNDVNQGFRLLRSEP